MDKEILKQLCNIAGMEHVLVDEPMHKHTTFKVGGKADYYILPHTIDEIKSLILFLKEQNIPFCIVGNGSNLLVGDKGYHGAIIRVYKNFNQIKINQTSIKAQAGAMLSDIAAKACEAGLKNFEFAAGIPGTIGGAAVMNAGAYGGEMQQVLTHVTVMNEEGTIQTLTNEELQFGYRTSVISTNHYMVLEAEIGLEYGDCREIKAMIDDYGQRRADKQPLEFPTAGSTFKRPKGYFAGKLIMDAGLRGYSIGGAQVSKKHCGFIINKNNATAKDVVLLIQYVQNQVFTQFGVKLETEVKMLGEF